VPGAGRGDACVGVSGGVRFRDLLPTSPPGTNGVDEIGVSGETAAKRDMSWLFHAASISPTSATASSLFTTGIVGLPGRCRFATLGSSIQVRELRLELR
jgi:hypothetical protein